MKNRRREFAVSLVAILILVALAGSRVLDAGETVPAPAPAPAPVTLRGTVVDMHCYVTHGNRNATHTACANACIARGVPAGFLAEDGTLYVLFGEKPFSVKDQVAGLADVSAVVKGTVSDRNGIKGIQLSSIERVK